MKKGYWKTKDGKEIRIKDMTDIHLFNTIKFVEKIAESQREELLFSGYSSLCEVHGEMAEYAIESSLNEVRLMSIEEFASDEYPVYRYLKNEAKKRKLLC